MIDVEKLKTLLSPVEETLPWRWDSVFPRDLVTPTLRSILVARDPVDEKERTLLVAAVNALPQLLAVYEAAKEAADTHDRFGTDIEHGTPVDHPRFATAMSTLRKLVS